MRHNYVEISAQAHPLQEMLWQRQELGRKLGEVAIRLNQATSEYNEVIAQIIQMNDLIRIEEDMNR
ncbi:MULTISPECIES: hypothetical protein [Arthrobacter]|uniref:Uncharacterized protein n=1 Tax=Arthrobacter terricola TaxID=2547396 RepID=A0A4R5KJD7_9MICC|nr:MULTISPECIES: hypothetical protein [Arthrobacter]MBT8161450.1 hypothetical protein [Arthrobacter sp. GN70]TDF95621.1 hypothetical protein E1809_11380 [Arthrobacter terricola]